MAVKGSPNYVWFTAQMLGRGAMGNVYLARHRKKGTQFAAKVFNPETRMMQKDYMAAELRILESLPRHENIIKFITVEEETHSKDKVFIMELCESGSLQNILDMPDNFYGLPEDEFLLAFKHISAALGHLAANRIVHRDIKPGNILQQVTADARHVYKLIDFGAACRLDDDDEGFKSLCGTEEYLHPRMHQAAFIRRIPGQRYDHTVDLWSFGVTLYQCAAGKLPFVPKAGIRNDKPTMHTLMHDKADDVISRIEKTDGMIESSRELPTTTSLTSGTRTVVTSILRQLLSVNHAVQPAVFFDTVNELFKKIKVYIFDLFEGQLLTVYLHKTNTLMHLQEAIAEQTSIPASHQLLLLFDGRLHSPLSSSERIEHYQNTSPEEPILLLSTRPTPESSRTHNWSPAIARVSDYPAGLDQVADARWAREVCGMLCYLLRFVTRARLTQELMATTKQALRSSLLEEFQNIPTVRWQQEELTAQLRDMAEDVTEFIRISKLDHVSAASDCRCHDNLQAAFDQAQQRVSELVVEAESIQQKYDKNWAKLLNLGRKSEKIPCVHPGRCKEKVDKMVGDSTSLYRQIQDDKNKELHHNDVEIHKYARSELKRLCRIARELIDKHCIDHLNTNHQRTLNDVRKLRDLQSHLKNIAERLGELGEQQKSTLKQMTKIFTIKPPQVCHSQHTESLALHSGNFAREEHVPTPVRVTNPTDSGIGKLDTASNVTDKSRNDSDYSSTQTKSTQIDSACSTLLSLEDIDLSDEGTLEELNILQYEGVVNHDFLSSYENTSSGRTSLRQQYGSSHVEIVVNSQAELDLLPENHPDVRPKMPEQTQHHHRQLQMHRKSQRKRFEPVFQVLNAASKDLEENSKRLQALTKH